jgi:hypothetical protein
MNQVNARHEIIREWRSLPKELRETDEQAAAFAMQIKDKYKFSSDTPLSNRQRLAAALPIDYARAGAKC